MSLFISALGQNLFVFKGGNVVHFHVLHGFVCSLTAIDYSNFTVRLLRLDVAAGFFSFDVRSSFKVNLGWDVFLGFNGKTVAFASVSRLVARPVLVILPRFP